MSTLSIRNAWIILASYLAPVYVGNLSAVNPITQQDLGRSFTQAGSPLALAQGDGYLLWE